MRAGALDQRIDIQQVTETRDSYGGVTDTWSNYAASVPAAVKTKSGNENFLAQHVVTESTHIVDLRYRSGVTTKMRVKWGTRYLDIIFIDDSLRRKGKLMLVCKEVV